jgi:hypothetical protein
MTLLKSVMIRLIRVIRVQNKTPIKERQSWL